MVASVNHADTNGEVLACTQFSTLHQSARTMSQAPMSRRCGREHEVGTWMRSPLDPRHCFVNSALHLGRSMNAKVLANPWQAYKRCVVEILVCCGLGDLTSTVCSLEARSNIIHRTFQHMCLILTPIITVRSQTRPPYTGRARIHHSTILTPPSRPTRYSPSHSLTSSSLFPPLVTLKTPLTSLAAPVPSSRTLNTLRAQCACCTVKAADSLSIGVGAALVSGCVAERNGPSDGVVRSVLWTEG
jgi:hypothetical protein